MSKTAQRKEASHLPLPSSPPEKRRSQRRETRLRVDFCPLVPVGQGLIIGGPHRGIAINISTAGLFISDGGLLLMGTTIHLFLRLPIFRPIPWPATAKWSVAGPKTSLAMASAMSCCGTTMPADWNTMFSSSMSELGGWQARDRSPTPKQNPSGGPNRPLQPQEAEVKQRVGLQGNSALSKSGRDSFYLPATQYSGAPRSGLASFCAGLFNFRSWRSGAAAGG